MDWNAALAAFLPAFFISLLPGVFFWIVGWVEWKSPLWFLPTKKAKG